MAISVVSIAGFTGRLARLITKHLLEHHPETKIHGITRTPGKVDTATRNSPRVKIFEASASDTDALRQGLAGANVAICCYLGDNELMLAGQKTLIDACISEGVARYIASDWCLDFRGLKLGDHPLKDPMIQIHAYLEEQENSGKIQAVHILNGGFMDIMLGPWGGSLNTKEHTYQYWGTGDETLDMTTYSEAAAFTAEVAADSTAVGFQKVLGDSKSPKQIAEVYQQVYGEKLNLEHLGSLSDLKSKMAETLNQFPHDPFKWMAMHYLYYMLNGTTSLGQLDAPKYTNLRHMGVEDYFRSRPKKSLSGYHKS